MLARRTRPTDPGDRAERLRVPDRTGTPSSPRRSTACSSDPAEARLRAKRRRSRPDERITGFSGHRAAVTRACRLSRPDSAAFRKVTAAAPIGERANRGLAGRQQQARPVVQPSDHPCCLANSRTAAPRLDNLVPGQLRHGAARTIFLVRKYFSIGSPTKSSALCRAISSFTLVARPTEPQRTLGAL